jgi:hypothetical protein
MKALLLVCLMIGQSVLAKEKYPDDVHTINWSDKNSLSYGYLQMCDDSYFPNFRLIVPGRINREFYFKIDTNDCSIKQRQTNVSGSVATEFIIQGGCVGTIEIQKSGSTLKAEIDMSDAC